MTEVVVLLDDAGNAIGTAPKETVHHADTPLHLAFSAYLFTPDGRLVLTRRATDKRTFPGVWTNSVCGHPAPDEDLGDAVRRRALLELDVELSTLRLVLPAFAYRAEMLGVVEHELCPVHMGVLADDSTLTPDPDEVDDVELVDWTTFATEVLDGGRDISPWCAWQVAELVALGPDPIHWPAADPAGLPPAARHTTTMR